MEKAHASFEYWLISTTDENGNKATHGGMVKRHDPQQRISNYIGVQSIEEYTSKIEKLGGKILVPKMAVPGNGFMSLCMDTEGNTFSLWKADASAK